MYLRLQNCLQTILDLETDANGAYLQKYFGEEFGLLKDYLKQVETLEMEEEDISRLEQATATLLLELQNSTAFSFPSLAGKVLQ